MAIKRKACKKVILPLRATPFLFVGLNLVLSLSACGGSMDQAAARKVSDSFMSDLVADRVGDALNRMQGSASYRSNEPHMRKLFEYCGRPLDYEFKHYERGVRATLDGRATPVLNFYYAAKTTQHAKGVCFFSVGVVPDDKELKVAVFGPLKLIQGQLPEWLR